MIMAPKNSTNKENENPLLGIEVGSEVLEKVRKGEVTHIAMDITEDNQNLILETIKGHLILKVALPDTYHSCYFYNDGEFPYAIKDSLRYAMLSAGEDDCLAAIVGFDVQPGTRFRFQGPGKPSIEDPNGDSCIWQVALELVPIRDDSKSYLMRWNPSISSFTEKDYKECVEKMSSRGFYLNWSISEWEEARRGDTFYMMRVGDDKAGIVFGGIFLSDPYVSEDWAGSTKRRLYVDMICTPVVEPGKKPELSLEKLQAEMPDFEWAKGHSGVLLSEEVATKLEILLDESKEQ